MVLSYPGGGISAVAAILTERTRAAIQVKATKMGIAQKRPRINPPVRDPRRYEKPKPRDSLGRGKPVAVAGRRYTNPDPAPLVLQPRLTVRPGADDYARLPSLTHSPFPPSVDEGGTTS